MESLCVMLLTETFSYMDTGKIKSGKSPGWIGSKSGPLTLCLTPLAIASYTERLFRKCPDTACSSKFIQLS